MTTTPEERAEISRRNSLRVRGLGAREGKRRSKMNAVKHGLTAATPVLPGEDPEAFRSRVGDWTDHLRPATRSSSSWSSRRRRRRGRSSGPTGSRPPA